MLELMKICFTQETFKIFQPHLQIPANGGVAEEEIVSILLRFLTKVIYHVVQLQRM